MIAIPVCIIGIMWLYKIVKNPEFDNHLSYRFVAYFIIALEMAVLGFFCSVGYFKEILEQI